MRDATIINEFGELRRSHNALAYHMQLGFSGEALFDETMKALLIKKGIITEEEFKEALGEKIREVNAKEEEAAKAQEKELIKPTQDEVSKIEDTKQA
jgi:flagellar hook-basal body complex protein FliE